MHVIAAAETLDAWLEPVDALVNECKIHCDPDSARVTAVDPANVAMVDAELDPHGFEAYDVGGETIGLNLERLLDIVGLADSDEFVQLSLDAETSKLEVTLDTLDYTLALIDHETIRDEPDLPDDLDWSCEVTVEGRDIDQALTAADLCSDHIELGSDGDVFTASAQGDTDDVVVSWDADECIQSDFGPAGSLFSLEYLDDISAPIGKPTEVNVTVGDELPAIWEYECCDGHVDITYMVAPRIQSGGS